MPQTFRVICADPPFAFSDKLNQSDTKRGASANYSTMSISDIKKMNVKNLIDHEGTVLALWVPSVLLQEGLDIMKEWGFNFKQTYIWVKVKKDPLDKFKKLFLTSSKKIEEEKPSTKIKQVLKNFKDAYKDSVSKFICNDILSFYMGRLFRQTHEICLIGTSNNKIYKRLQNKSQRSVCLAQNMKHSAKPKDLQDSLDLMFPDKTDNKIELFARRCKPGWVCLGNAVCNGEDIRDSLAKL